VSSENNSERLVAGIDLVSQFSERLSRYRYAIVMMEGDKVVYENSDVSLPQLIRLLWDYKPSKLAVDNVLELGGSESKVLKVLSLIPPQTEVVQVTVVDGVFVDIKELARKEGILVPQGKPSPLKTAYLCAVLAAKGMGSKVKVYEKKTKIIVSRGRSPGAGGSRSGKYIRNIRGLILRATKEIKEALDKRNIDYDLYVRKSRGGLEGSVFIVYAPRDKLAGIVKPKKGHDIVVTIKPLLKSRIEIEGLGGLPTRLSKYVVVGLDPGMETGLAIIDLDFNPLLVLSKRGLDREEIINLVMNYGIPVMVATDKNPVPDMVKKIAATLNASLFVPSESLSIEEKEELIEWLKRHVDNNVTVSTTHERDALAAATKALKSYEAKFTHLESKLAELNINIPINEVKYLVIKGKSVSEALEEIIARSLDSDKGVTLPSELIKRLVSNVEFDLRNRIRSLEEERKELIRENELLKQKVKELEYKLIELRNELELRSREESAKVKSEREVQALLSRYNVLATYARKLERSLEEFKDEVKVLTEALRGVLSGELKLVRRIQLLKKDHLTSSVSKVGPLKKGELIYVVNPVITDDEALNTLKRLGIIILTSNLSKELIDCFMRRSIPVIDVKDNLVLELDDLVLLRSEGLDKLIKKAQRAIEDYRKRMMKVMTEEDLIKLVNNYRAELSLGRLENT